MRSPRCCRGRRRVGRPQSNDSIQRFRRTLLAEHLRVKGRTSCYESVDEMRADLDATSRPKTETHRGRGMETRTPYQVFKKGIRKPRSRKKSARNEVKAAAGAAGLAEARCQANTVPVHFPLVHTYNVPCAIITLNKVFGSRSPLRSARRIPCNPTRIVVGYRSRRLRYGFSCRSGPAQGRTAVW